MDKHSILFAGGVVLLFAVVGLVASCPGEGAADFSTPDGAFLATQAAIEAGEYSVAWNAMSVGCRREWASATNKQQAQFSRSGPNYREFERFIQNQFGVDGETFLATSPERLYELFLAYNREKVLAYRISGEPRIDGDTAYLFISVGDGDSGSEWRFVRDVDRWLLDEGFGAHSGPE